MERIVIGTDGSAHAAEALRFGVAEAELHGAQVEVVAVAENPRLDSASAVAPDDSTAIESRAKLDAWVAEHLPGDHQVSTHLAHGDPVQELLERSVEADLLVLGARGTGGFKGLLMGSVSERLVETSNIPVAVVGSDAPPARGRVLVGYDGSRASQEALVWAAGEARTRGATLEIVHSWQVPAAAASPWVIVPIDEISDAGRQVIAEARHHPSCEGLEVEAHLYHGSPASGILQRAQEADLVVVGTRGHGRVASVLLGSVSRQVLHHSPVPVVVI